MLRVGQRTQSAQIEIGYDVRNVFVPVSGKIECPDVEIEIPEYPVSQIVSAKALEQFLPVEYALVADAGFVGSRILVATDLVGDSAQFIVRHPLQVGEENIAKNDIGPVGRRKRLDDARQDLIVVECILCIQEKEYFPFCGGDTLVHRIVDAIVRLRNQNAEMR